MILHIGALSLAAALSAFPAAAVAQDYPTRPIKLLIHTPPGSLVDVLGRIVGQELGDRLGQSLIVDNRAGGATMIAVEQLDALAAGRLHADDQHVRSDDAAVPEEELSLPTRSRISRRSRWW